MSETLDDVLPDDRADYQTVAVLRCDTCGATGRMYSTGEPRREQWWDCTACGTNDAKHTVVMASVDGSEVRR